MSPRSPLTWWLWFFAGLWPALAAQPKPNLIVILTDDIGWGDFQCYSAQSRVVAPNVDRLAREGMRFTHAHTPAALCAPTRYAMLTGNYPWRGRSAGGTWGFNVPSHLLPGQRTVAGLLRDAGYRTAMLGKAGFGGLHETKDGIADLTRPMRDGPSGWGFDYSLIIPRGHQSKPHVFLENEIAVAGATNLVFGRAPHDISERGWDHSAVAARLLAAAEKFIDECAGALQRGGTDARPFFLHLCTDGAHAPYVPAATLGGVPLRGATRMTTRTDMILATDIMLGRLVARLEHHGLLADTLICFTSDNGGIPTDRDHAHDAVGGLRGSKSEIWEGGHRVPFLVRWGDGTKTGSRIPPGTVREQPIGAHDIVATLLELGGARPDGAQALDSVSLVPVLLGRRGDDQPLRASLLVQSSPGRDAFDEGVWDEAAERLPPLARPDGPPRQVPASDGMAHAIYDGAWKLVLNMADEPAGLYHLTEDPAERSNLIARSELAPRVARMEKSYREIRAAARSAVPLP